MKTFTIDWRRGEESVITEIGKNHFRLNPLNICTKDGLNCEMDARIIMEINDDSIIFKNFSSFPVFADNTLSILVRNFFTYKETEDVVTNRLKIQDELVKLLQGKLEQYDISIIAFMIVHTTMPSSLITCEEPKIIVRDVHIGKNVPDIESYIIICGLLGCMLLIVLSVVILLNILSIGIDIKIPIGLCMVISIAIIIISIYQCSEME